MSALVAVLLSLAAGAGGAADPAGPTDTVTIAPPRADTLRLGALQVAAERRDPRHRQLALQERIAGLRLRNLDAEWLPRLSLRAEASYQTETPSVTAERLGFDPAGTPVPGFEFSGLQPPKDRYDVAAEVEQLVFDGGRLARRGEVERARLRERSAETRSALYGLREELHAAFFEALLAQERSAQLGLLADDLDARRELVAARVREGAALPSHLAAVEAERIRVGQDRAEAEAARRAALGRLEGLLGRRIDAGDVLAVPDLEVASEAARAAIERGAPSEPAGAVESRRGGAAPAAIEDGSDRGSPAPVGRGDRARAAVPFSERPEWQRLARTRERLRAEAALADADDRPRLSLFLRAAYARPGLDFFDDRFSPYALLGMRVQWPLLDWGGSERRGRAAELEAGVVEAEQEALVEALRRRTLAALGDVDRLEAAREGDGRAVALRAEIERAARRQLQEGVLLPAEYVEKRTDLFEARLRARVHRVELAEARARLLTTLGLGIPTDETGHGADAGLRVPVAPVPPGPSDEPGLREDS